MKKFLALSAVAVSALLAGNVSAVDLDSATTSAAYGVKQKADEAAAKVQNYKAGQAADEGRYLDAASAKAKEYKNDITAKKAEWDKEQAAKADAAKQSAEERKAERDKAVQDAKDSLGNLKDAIAN